MPIAPDERAGAEQISTGALGSKVGFSQDVDVLDGKMPVCVNFPREFCREEFTQNAVFSSNLSKSVSGSVCGIGQPYPCVIAG